MSWAWQRRSRRHYEWPTGWRRSDIRNVSERVVGSWNNRSLNFCSATKFHASTRDNDDRSSRSLELQVSHLASAPFHDLHQAISQPHGGKKMANHTGAAAIHFAPRMSARWGCTFSEYHPERHCNSLHVVVSLSSLQFTRLDHNHHTPLFSLV